ncbi:hypothetical protein [Herbaspirillum sp. SJZ107]|uniref:hypothetical protein n=1 Tax=Herbaspirillum sp. SJZ107 TaxID=2572881 RepID=UPI0011509A9F|nr:hypothetical protein [Herbaspirillum sp. SJZ107]TQK01137.1 hypothetical protein FBX97_5653 [Herbaspirillum sp. SJZ107]
MQIYRAVRLDTYKPGHVYTRHPGTRLPANVPYFVDNIWELCRPDARPSRRHAVYASPTVELALDGAAGVGQPRDGFVVGRVECQTPPKTFQLSVADARYHRDVRNLQKFVHDWLAKRHPPGSADRLALAPLFLPGVTRGEIMGLMEGNAPLREFVDKLAVMVTVWSDAPDCAAGEILFELEGDNSYILHPV